jgi:hypothetical protein
VHGFYGFGGMAYIAFVALRCRSWSVLAGICAIVKTTVGDRGSIR